MIPANVWLFDAFKRRVKSGDSHNTSLRITATPVVVR